MYKHIDQKKFDAMVEAEQTYNDKKVKVVSERVNAKITVRYDKNHDSNCAFKSGSSYSVILNGQIPIRSGIDHELSHVKEGSLDSTFWKPYKSIIRSWYNKKMPTELVSDIAMSKTDSICHDAMNIIEDIRIESIDGAIYVGRKYQYESMCKATGNEWNQTGFKPEGNEIHGYVLAKRFFRDDLIPDEHKAEVNRIYEASKETTVKGIHKVFYDWLHGSLGNYIIEVVREAVEEYDKTAKELAEERKQKADEYSSLSNAIDKMLDMCEEEHMTDEEQEQLSQLRKDRNAKAEEVSSAGNREWEERRKLETKSRQGMDANMTGHNPREQRNDEIYWRPTDKQMDAIEDKMSKVDAKKEKASKRKMIEAEKTIGGLGGEVPPSISTKVEKLNMQPMGQPEIYQDAVSDIRKLFNTLKQKTKPQISEDGDDIDIETMLEVVKKGSNEFYIDNAKVEGTSILIAVDCSGSMKSDDRLTTCQNICATMFRAVEKIPTIDMKVVCYGGASSTYGEHTKTGVYDINNEHECSLMGTDSEHILTPTTNSLLYCTEKINKMKGKKKLMLYLTDGMPQNAEQTNYKTLAEQAGKTYKTIKANNPRLVIKPLLIDIDGHTELIKTIFGKDYMRVSTATVSDFIRREFRQAIIRSM